MVPNHSVPDGWTRESLEREQLHAAVGHEADVEAVVGDDQLALRVDPRQRARHPGKRVDGGRSAREAAFEQPAFANVEPPGGAGRGIVGRPLAEMAALGREHPGRYVFHQTTPQGIVPKR
jgi:hypothetical protein